MIPEFGHYALVLALALALVQATVPFQRSPTRAAPSATITTSSAGLMSW